MKRQTQTGIVYKFIEIFNNANFNCSEFFIEIPWAKRWCEVWFIPMVNVHILRTIIFV